MEMLCGTDMIQMHLTFGPYKVDVWQSHSSQTQPELMLRVKAKCDPWKL